MEGFIYGFCASLGLAVLVIPVYLLKSAIRFPSEN